MVCVSTTYSEGSKTTLLHIEVSPMGENSISRAVTAEFLDAWKAANPGGTIIERDLAANPVPVLDGEAIFADYTPRPIAPQPWPPSAHCARN